MKKSSLLCILMMFVWLLSGIASANTEYTVTPVKQYSLPSGMTYSDWYRQYHDQLGPEHNGKLYGAKYKKHLALWMQVEGFKTEKDINHSPKRVLTVPVSGALEQKADHYAVLVSDGSSLPITVIVNEQSYTRSSKPTAADLFVKVSASAEPKAQAKISFTQPTDSIALTGMSGKRGIVHNALAVLPNGGSYDIYRIGNWSGIHDRSLYRAILVQPRSAAGPQVIAT